MNTLLTNANVFTVNSRQPRASAIAIANDRIVAVGSDSELEGIRLPNLQRVDMGGAFVLPGLIDAHVHLQMSGFWMGMVDLFEVASIELAVTRVRARAQSTPRGEWVRGRGWLQAVWKVDRLPTAADIDPATADHPVALTAKSGHALWVNSVALRQCGISAATRDPEGGKIERDAAGNPTGLLHENAMRLVYDRIPPATLEMEERVTLEVMRGMNKVGLTGVHCMDGKGGIASFNTYQRLVNDGRASLRVVKNLPAQDMEAVITAGIRSGFGGPWLRVGGIKFFKDGALGNRTGEMLADYSDDPGNRGISTYEPEELADAFQRCHNAGLATITHAIGDKANRDVLNAIEFSRKALGDRGLRDRIEHCQHLHPDDIPRWGALNVIASVQPIHATQDFPMAFPRLGAERCATTYPFASLVKSGARLAFGTDSPVESFDPFACMYAAVTRRRPDGAPGPDGWFPEERVNIEDTIRAYTLDAAYAGGTEHEVGSIEAGKFADLAVLDRDLTRVPAADIPTTRVQRVMLNGEWIVG